MKGTLDSSACLSSPQATLRSSSPCAHSSTRWYRLPPEIVPSSDRLEIALVSVEIKPSGHSPQSSLSLPKTRARVDDLIASLITREAANTNIKATLTTSSAQVRQLHRGEQRRRWLTSELPTRRLIGNGNMRAETRAQSRARHESSQWTFGVANMVTTRCTLNAAARSSAGPKRHETPSNDTSLTGTYGPCTWSARKSD